MEFDYDSLVALAAVVREGGFESAAKSMNVTQSAVSQRIKQLESRLGTLLIVRGRPCVPTESGLQLCQHLEQVRLLQHDLANRMRDILGDSDGGAATVRIAVNSDSLATWFPSALRRASEELNIQFEVIDDDQEHTEQSLSSGDALAVVTSREAPVPGCRRISLGSMEYLAIASPDFVNRHFTDGVTVATVAAAPRIAFDRKDTLPEQWMMLAFGESGKGVTHMMPSYEGYLKCCLNGMGWGMMPTVTVDTFIRSGKLVELVPDKRINISLHWQASTQSSEVMRMLGELILDDARKHLLPDQFRPE